MGDATRVDVTADGDKTETSATTEAPATPTQPRDWKALATRVRPWAAMVLAALLWWPVGFSGRADWMHLPFSQGAGGVGQLSGSAVLLGALVAAAVVSALVPLAWPKFLIAAGLTALAWVLSEGDVTFAGGERPVLAALAGAGMLVGLGVGARARNGVVPAATFLALVAGLAPANYSRGLILAVAVALPFWAATADRVAPTIFAVVRVVITWLVAVVISLGLNFGFAKLAPNGLAKPGAAAKTVGQGFVDFVRDHGLETVKAAPGTYMGWFWFAIVLAIAFVVAANVLKRRRTKAS